jgi:hypothetical protein
MFKVQLTALAILCGLAVSVQARDDHHQWVPYNNGVRI